MLAYFNKKIIFLLTGVFFIFACSLGTPAPAEPAFDATKVVLELEATSMALQLTQSAMNSQAAQPTAAPVIAPTQVPAQQEPTTVPPTAASSMPPFNTWIKSASILLFEDMADSVDRRRVINQALSGMSLRYTDVSDALGNYKNEILSGGPDGNGWDLIISGKELRNGVQGEFYVYLNDAIGKGSGVIIEEWNMDDIGGGKLSLITSRCGVKLERDWIGKPIEDHLIFPVEGSDPVHHKPNEGIALTNPTGYWLGADLGDRMMLTAGSKAIPLWGLYPNSYNKALTAVKCIDGRLIIQTHSSHSYGESRIILMWQNYIYNTLKARYDYLAAQ